jgi:REP element-mobilizing transposase RayT
MSETLAFGIPLHYMTYLITFNCYGAWLPGDQRGWIDRTRGDQQGGYHVPSAGLEAYARELMLHDSYVLDQQRSEVVLASIQAVCRFRGWELIAAHIRATHIHCVVGEAIDPSRVMAAFKAYASRSLNEVEGQQRRWARGGNARVLSNREAVGSAIRYIADDQGEPMALYVDSL